MADPYIAPDSSALRNKFGIRDAGRLDYVERRLVTERAAQGVPKGKFDLDHLRAIHKHLFQDIYDWAGEVRTVEISKGGHQFQFRQFIETGMADIHRRLVADRFLSNKKSAAFAEKAAEIIGDINYVHPFREGNGRTQLLYLQQLAENAGYILDLNKMDLAQWLDASKQAHGADYNAMAQCISKSIEPGISLGRGL